MPFKSKHGMYGTSTYQIWQDMKRRCYAENRPAWKHYGGRGIKVCDRWLDFENFYEDMGVRPDGMSIERVDNDKGYEPGNCRWATLKEQHRNYRQNFLVYYQGVQMPLIELCEKVGVPYSRTWQRLRKGLSVEEAMK